MNRPRATIVLGALLATGCLFPSFDDMRGAPADARSETNATGAGGPKAGAEDEPSGGGDAGGATTTSADASTDAPAETPGTIACGGSSCPVAPGSYCCAGFQFGSTCGEPGGEDACRNLGQGHVLTCDDDTDCTGGRVCCLVDGAKTSTCSATCSGRVLCSPASPSCPAGQACTGTADLGSGATIAVCQ